MYAGRAAMSKQLRRVGFTVHACDMNRGVGGGDVLKYEVFQKLANAIKSNTFVLCACRNAM